MKKTVLVYPKPSGEVQGGGVYALLLRINVGKLMIGSLGEVDLSIGSAMYIGSAQAGFRGRVSRHFKRGKKKHWHIDYLTESTPPNLVFLLPGEGKEMEERIAFKMSKHLPFIHGFGSSDDRSPSHLFLSQYPRELIQAFLNSYLTEIYPTSSLQ